MILDIEKRSEEVRDILREEKNNEPGIIEGYFIRIFTGLLKSLADFEYNPTNGNYRK